MKTLKWIAAALTLVLTMGVASAYDRGDCTPHRLPYYSGLCLRPYASDFLGWYGNGGGGASGGFGRGGGGVSRVMHFGGGHCGGPNIIYFSNGQWQGRGITRFENGQWVGPHVVHFQNGQLVGPNGPRFSGPGAQGFIAGATGGDPPGGDPRFAPSAAPIGRGTNASPTCANTPVTELEPEVLVPGPNGTYATMLTPVEVIPAAPAK